MNNELFMELHPTGDEAHYHGRTGIIQSYDDEAALIYFDDVDDEELIPIEELIQQNY